MTTPNFTSYFYVNCSLSFFSSEIPDAYSSRKVPKRTTVHSNMPLLITKEELESELGAREIYEGKTKKELQNLLYENFHSCMTLHLTLRIS